MSTQHSHLINFISWKYSLPIDKESLESLIKEYGTSSLHFKKPIIDSVFKSLTGYTLEALKILSQEWNDPNEMLPNTDLEIRKQSLIINKMALTLSEKDEIIEELSTNYWNLKNKVPVLKKMGNSHCI